MKTMFGRTGDDEAESPAHGLRSGATTAARIRAGIFMEGVMIIVG
jgi:hypothetical protein